METAITATAIVVFFDKVGILPGIGVLSGLTSLGMLAWGPDEIRTRRIAMWLLVIGWTTLAVCVLPSDAIVARLSG